MAISNKKKSLDAAPSRPPPNAARLLLPIWGIRYIKQFVEFGLPTLLASGNLPAVAKSLPSTLVFLTSSPDAALLREHPAVLYLASICDVEFELIDDLITGDNYSTTITLAYARGVRAAGPAMTDTCFFFLISDYLMANGSLAHVLSRIQAGASGVLAGNFQVIEQDAIATFYPRFDQGTPELTLPPRELMSWAFDHLHSMTTANTVNFPLSSSTHSNRLFWRVDKDTLIGRFYLMHMICIRPEVTDFVIGSSCDYSFIPELCPSDNVEVLTDSDDYLVIEMQPEWHETRFLRIGVADPERFAAVLSEWTTARHRKNVHSTIVFHAGELPDRLPEVVGEADAFVEKVESLMTPTPQPYRDHPYWIGAISAHQWAIRRMHGEPDSPEDQPQQQARGFRAVVQGARDLLFGRPPNVRPWHPRWPDYRTMLGAVSSVLPEGACHLAVVSATPGLFRDWLRPLSQSSVSLDTRRLVGYGNDEYMPLVAKFDGCLLIMSEDEIEQGKKLFGRIMPMLKPNGFLTVAILNGRGMGMANGFAAYLARSSPNFFDLSISVTDVKFVEASWLRWTCLRLMIDLFSGMLRRPLLYYALAVLVSVPLLLGCLIGNLLAMHPRRKFAENVVCSCAVMVLRADGRPCLPDFSPPRELYAHADRYKEALADIAGPPAKAAVRA